MIVFSRKNIILATQPDGTAPANFPAQTALKYDQVSYVNNDVVLKPGDVVPLDQLEPEPSPLPSVFLHVTVSGGDGRVPPGYCLDTPIPIRVHAELRALVNEVDIIVPISGTWRIPFGGSSALYREVTLTNGIADFTIDTIPEGGFTPAVEYFDKIAFGGQLYEVQIVGDPRFVGYRVAPQVQA